MYISQVIHLHKRYY